MTDIITTDKEEAIVAPWLMQEDESSTWYNRFLMYYLPLGPGRTLTQAYLRYCENENPEVAEKIKAKEHYTNVASQWSRACAQYDWRLRAEAFDRFNALEFRRYVQDARKHLIEHAQDAAETLVKNLASPRQGVVAAKEILNRVGLPSATVVGHSNITPYSADDFNRAQKELEEWENKIRDEEVIEGDVRDADSDGRSESGGDA
jgi:hypothetical protein